MNTRNLLPAFITLFFLSLFYTGCERATEVDITDDGLPPGVPGGVEVIYAGEGEILIDWLTNVEPDLSGYIIYRLSDDSVYLEIDRTTRSSYWDDSLDYDKEYFYKISSIDNYGRESALSNAVSGVPLNYNPPREPRYITVYGKNWPSSKLITIAWQQNPETDVMRYLVYRDTLSGFSPDSSNFIGYSQSAVYDDTTDLDLYVTYYYKLKAEDRGGLISRESIEGSDIIHGIPEQVYPMDGSVLSERLYFEIETLNVPAEYEIILQDNPFFGEVWRKRFYSASINEIIRVNFDSYIQDLNAVYYWRVVTYSNGSGLPNSVSGLNSFRFN